MHVEFYVFEQANQQEMRIGLCHLIENWYKNNWRIAILCASQNDMELLDLLLWTFSDTSFIPHSFAKETFSDSPVRLFLESSEISDEINVIINLSSQPLLHPTPTHLLVEIVFSDEYVQQLARNRYKLYRDHGYQLKTIKLPVANVST